MQCKTGKYLLIASILLFTHNGFADMFNDALRSTRNKDYTTALSQWQSLANEGNVLAQYNLGLFYEHGMGVVTSDTQARYWYTRASQKGLVAAYVKLKKNSVKPGKQPDFVVTLSPQSWIRAQDPLNYTLQIASSTRRTQIEKYYSENKLFGEAGYYHYKRQGEDWYALVYGAYPSKSDANAAIANLPEKLRKWSPWVRRIKSIQRALIDD